MGLGLSETVLYVRSGAILPLQHATVQRAEDAGGMLLVEVYAGQDGSFEMTEDDGVTLAYVSDASKSTKTTMWEWNDTARQLSWRASGGGPPTYTSVRAHAKGVVHTIGAHVQLTRGIWQSPHCLQVGAVLYTLNGGAPQSGGTAVPLGATGTIMFKTSA